MASGATLTTAAALLKERYLPRLREQINDKTKFTQRIESSSAGVTNEIGGKYVTFGVHTRRNSGTGSRYEYEALPTPGNQGNAAARVGLKYAYQGIQLSGQSISLTDSDPKAFASVLTQEVDRATIDAQKDFNRQLFMDGTGRIAGVRAAGTGVNIVPVDDARLFQIGEMVDIVTVSGWTVAVSNRQVTATDLTANANTVTLSGATFNVTAPSGGAATQILTRTGSSTGASGNREITGLLAIVNNSGTLYNIDPTVEPEWTSTVRANGGTNRSLSEGLMNELYDAIGTRGGDTTVMFTSRGVRRSYANLLTQTRHTVNTTKFSGGYSGLAYTTDDGEIPLMTDDDAPLNRIWFLNEKSFTLYREKDWDWLDMDGSMWKMVSDTNGHYDAYFAYLHRYHELGVDRRNSQGLLADISES